MKKKFIIQYAFFAFIASVINLATQRIILFYGKSNLFFAIAILIGTFFGLIVKYFLDKRWIFHYKTSGIKSQGYKLFLYSFMGIFSTIIFWSTETFFWIIWQTEKMREIGALIGLGLGYIVKYNLDKNFVFKKK